MASARRGIRGGTAMAVIGAADEGIEKAVRFLDRMILRERVG
jgi:hypothetical protein